MIFSDQMNNLMIYRKPMFLPTLEADKKKKSSVFLLTPNYESSKRLIQSPLLINKLRFQSYYIEKDLTYFISSKVLNSTTESAYLRDKTYEDLYHCVNEMSASDRKKLKSTDYGLPKQEKYPMYDADHVRLAIRFFNYVSPEDEKELATNIIRKMKKFNLNNIKVGNNNRFYPYWKSAYNTISESAVDTVDDSGSIYNHKANPKQSVSAIIEDGEGRILVLDHKKCKGLTLPGGKLDENETVEDAIKREVREELGIEIKEFDVYSENTFLCEYPAGSNTKVYFKDTTFVIRSYDGEIENKEPDKHFAILWYTREQLMNGVEYDYSELLKAYLEDYSSKINDLTSTSVYALSTFIRFNGYQEDVEVAKRFVSPQMYFELLSQYLHLPINNIKDIPILDITVGPGDDTETEKSYIVNKLDGHDIISLYLPQYDPKIVDLNTYILGVIYDISIAVICTRYEGAINTSMPRIICDYVYDIDSVYHQWATYLLYDCGLTLKDLYEPCSTGDYERIFELLSQKFNINREDLVFETNSNEATESINMENIGRKFKYATVSKVKRLNSMRGLKSIENTIKKIKDSFNKFETPNANTTTTSTNKDEESATSENFIYENYLDSLTENVDYRRIGDMVLLSEDAKYDAQLKRLLYNDRIRQRSEIIELNKKVKEDIPEIKYAYPELKQYAQRNLFVDLYYYNEVFFKNNTWKQLKGFELYLDLLDRLINDPRIKSFGYEKQTIFIPVLDWSNDNKTRMWLYKEGINPISIIFELMRTSSSKIKKVFGDKNIIFFGKDKYFKMNFSQIDDTKKASMKFKLFIEKILLDKEFEPEYIDTTLDHETPEVIKTNIIDQIDVTKGVDITTNVAKAERRHKEMEKMDYKPDPEDTIKDEDDAKLDFIAVRLKDASDVAVDTDNAYDILDKQHDLKSILIDLDSMRSDTVKIDPARAARINKLDTELLDKNIKGKPIKDILSTNNNEDLSVTELKVSSPNTEWQQMKYMNFDKDYDLNADILKCLRFFSTVSNPISIRNIKVEDNSTSQDRLDLYTVEMEDFRGKRFTVKLDIPKIKDNRFLLRGNEKSIQTQFFNMPIIKTNLDTCQIISNYQKIFIYRINDDGGRTLPITSRFIKAIEKYQGKDIKAVYGDNTKICNKYELPMDYIDMASIFNTIEDKNYIFYFNQDQIRSLEGITIDYSIGIPIGIHKKNNNVVYYTGMQSYTSGTFTHTLKSCFTMNNEEFREIFDNTKESSSGAFSRCNILNSKIPLAVVLGYMEGLSTTLKKADIGYRLESSLTKDMRDQKDVYSWIRFKDGYLVYTMSYSSSLLLNGLKQCSTELYSITDIDNKNMYLEFLDDFGGRIKADGLDNFYDCLVDPITKEVLEFYKLPTDVVSILLYANVLLADNKFVKHSDTSSRRIRRTEMIAAYTYEALSEAYGSYANQLRHNASSAEFSMKQSIVIDKFLSSPISSDDSIINALNAVETTNSITFKGKAGLNSERSYSLDKRTYDESMINVLGMSTGFSANVGISRQATMDMNMQGSRGYIKTIDAKKDTDKLNTAKTLTATEAMTPFGSTRDDAPRTSMTFIQTAKHMVRTVESDPLLVTNGADEVLPYLTTDKFAFKAKDDGTVTELTDDFMIVSYKNGEKDYINLKQTIEKNSDGGMYVALKLDANKMKVGKKFSKNDILAYDKQSFSNSVGESDNIAYNIGKLAKVAIINSDEGFEDSGMCTESLSKKLTTMISMKMDRVIDKNATIFNMLKVGDEVDVDDALITWQNPFEEEDANILLRNLAGDKEYVSELGRNAIRSDLAGKIVDIRIYRTVELDELSDSLRKIVTAYEKPIKELKAKLDEQGIYSKDLPATYKLEPTGKLKGAVDGVLFEFYVEYEDIVAVGDKIVYYSANKGVMKTVVPQEDAPYTDFRPNEPVEAFVAETSIDKRMVCSSIIYGSLQKLMVELDRSCKDLAGIKYDDSKV